MTCAAESSRLAKQLRSHAEESRNKQTSASGLAMLEPCQLAPSCRKTLCRSGLHPQRRHGGNDDLEAGALTRRTADLDAAAQHRVHDVVADVQA